MSQTIIACLHEKFGYWNAIAIKSVLNSEQYL